jgi:hypothetical protein
MERVAIEAIRVARQVVLLRSIDKHGNRDLRQRIVSEGRGVRRHEHTTRSKNGGVSRLAALSGRTRPTKRSPSDAGATAFPVR